MPPNWPFIRDVGPARYALRTVARQVGKRLRGGNRLRLETGLEIWLPAHNQSASEIYVTGGHADWGSEDILVRHLDPEGAFIDVGANIGWYTMLCAPRVRRVYALEPDSRCWPALATNAETAGNVTVLRQPAWRRCEPVAFCADGDPATSHIGSGEMVDGITIDSLAIPERVCAMKIDVEGADLAAVEGAIDTIRRDQPLILTEFNASEINRPERLKEFADEVCYRLFAIPAFGAEMVPFDGRGKMIFLVPPRLHSQFP